VIVLVLVRVIYLFDLKISASTNAAIVARSSAEVSCMLGD
jgi:hypothetical protein